MQAFTLKICRLYDAGMSLQDIEDQTGASRFLIEATLSRYLETEELDFGDEMQ